MAANEVAPWDTPVPTGVNTPTRIPSQSLPPDTAPQQSVMKMHPYDPVINQPRPNSDGSQSTEITRTVRFPDGTFGNVPSLWWDESGNSRDFGSMSDDQLAQLAAKYESQTGKKFPRYKDIPEAETAAKIRSEKGGGTQGDITQEEIAPWDTVAPASTVAPQGPQSRKPVIFRQPDELFTANDYKKFEPVKATYDLQGNNNEAEVAELNKKKKLEVEQENQKLYESTGEPLTVFGIPLFDWRKQQTKDVVTGEPRTDFVPKPGGRDSLDVLVGGEPGAADRVAAGSALTAIKETVDFANWALKTMSGYDENDPYSHDRMAEAVDKAVKEFDAQFPNMPASNNVEKAAMEIGSVVVGAFGGGGAADAAKLGKLSSMVGPDAAKFLVNWFAQAKKIDPANARSKLDLITKFFVVDTVASNMGATVTTPSEVEPFSGGLLPDSGDKYLDTKAGTFVDNMAFSAVIGGLGQIIGRPIKAVLDKLSFTTSARQIDVAQTVFSIFDETAQNLDANELARRIDIFNEVLMKNKNFKLAIDKASTESTIELDSASALMMGAQEYYQKVFGAELNALDPQYAKDLVQEKAKTFVQNIASIRQTFKGNPQISAKDSAILQQVGGSFENAAQAIDQSVGGQSAQKSADIYGQPAADIENVPESLVRTPEGNVIPPDLNEVAAQASMDSMQQKNAFIQMFEEARGRLGSTAEERARFSKLTGEDLYNNYIRDKEAVDNLFNQISTEPVNALELAKAIKNAGDQEGLMRQLGIAPEEGAPIGKIGDDTIDQQTGAVISPVNDLAKKIEGMGLTVQDLIKKVRPLLANAKSAVYDSGRINTDTTQYQSLIDYLEQAARGTGDEYSIAMDQYKRFSDKWLSTQPLKDYANAADKVATVKTEGADWKPVETFTKGKDMAEKAGSEAFFAADAAYSDTEMKRFMEALRNGSNDPDIEQLMIGQAINQLVKQRPTGRLTSSDVMSVLGDKLTRLERTGQPQLIQQMKNTLEELRLAETGLADAQQADKKALELWQQTKAANRKSAAFKFVYQSANPGDTAALTRVTSTPEKAYQQIFNSPNAVNEVQQLLSQDASETARAGMQSEFLKWLKTKMFTKKTVGMSEDLSGVQDISGANVIAALGDQGNQTRQLINTVFSDKSENSQAIQHILTLMDQFVNLRGAKPNPFGSNTVNDTKLAQTVNLMITLTLGVLNPTATKARGISRLFLQGTPEKIKQSIEDIMDGMIADPDFMKKSMEALAKDRTGKTWLGYLNYVTGKTSGAFARGAYNVLHPTQEEQTTEAIPGFKQSLGFTDRTSEPIPGMDSTNKKPALNITVKGGNNSTQ